MPKKLTKFQKTKKCNSCGLVKKAKHFSKHGTKNPFSLKPFCKICAVIKTQSWIEKNRDKYNKYHYKYNQQHHG